MTDKPSFFYGYIVVIVSFFIMMLILGLHPSFGIFFKPIMEDMGWTRTVTSGAFSLSLVIGGSVGIFTGGLNDRFGPRVVITLCGLLSSVGYMLMSQVLTVWQLYLFYGLIIGAGSNVFVPLLSTIARWFVQRRSMMTGTVYAGAGVGMLIMPLLVNQLIATYGWRMACLVLGIIILVVVVSAAQFLRLNPSQVGQVAYGENHAVEGVSNWGTKLFSLKEALQTGQFWLFMSAMFSFGFCLYAIQVHIVPHVTDLGMSATSAAAILATIGGATVIGQTLLGSTGDKIGYKRAFLIGIILIAIAVFILMPARELWIFYLFAVIFGLAHGNCTTQESPIAAWLFGLASHGLILGLFAFSGTLGAAIGPVVSGYIFDMTGNYQLAFWVAAALAIIGIIATIFLKETSTESIPETAKSKAL